jgi:hypothetical protein
MSYYSLCTGTDLAFSKKVVSQKCDFLPEKNVKNLKNVTLFTVSATKFYHQDSNPDPATQMNADRDRSGSATLIHTENFLEML